MTATSAMFNDPSVGNEIRSLPCSNCYMCGGEGSSLYHDLEDRYFAAPGVWNLKKCRSASCGLVWLDPMPVKEDVGKAYQSYYTHSDPPIKVAENPLARLFSGAITKGYLSHAYGYDNGGSRLVGLLAYLVPPRRAALDFSVMYMPYIPRGRLLEVGCGSGNMLKIMADLGWQVEGVDFDSEAVKNCRRKGLNVHVGFLGDLRYPESCFDAITMSHLIEHVHDPLGLLEECCRILKPGGRLALVTPNIDSAGHRIYTSSWFHLDPPRHLRIFTVGSMKSLLEKAGFRKVKIDTTIRDAATAYAASRSVRLTSRYEVGVRQPWSFRLWGRAMQAVEWVWLTVDPSAGEEIAAMAQK